MFNKFFFTLFVLSVAISSLPMRPVHAAAESTVALSSIEPGNLIRASATPAVYYYGKDGFRYVFPNDKTYFTWYTDFDAVKWVSDADLGKLQIGGNVTYKPGVKMVKINTDPKTYAVDAGGTLRWVSSEAMATSLYGSAWNTMIDDVPDGFFSNYTIGESMSESEGWTAAATEAAATNIDDDRGLTAFTEIDISDFAFHSDDVTIQAGEVVRFVNNDPTKHTATADDLKWGSGTISGSGGFWQRRFSTTGTYTYFCSYHPSMTGTIIVE